LGLSPQILPFYVANKISAHSMMLLSNTLVAVFDIVTPTPSHFKDNLNCPSTFWIASLFGHNERPFITSTNIQLKITKFVL